MDKREFDVQGSANDPYKVVFVKSGNNLSAFCTCPAGEFGTHCKHRINILLGISKGIVSGNEADVEIVASWVPGSDVEIALEKVAELTKEDQRIKKELGAAKKALAQAFRD